MVDVYYPTLVNILGLKLQYNVMLIALFFLLGILLILFIFLVARYMQRRKLIHQVHDIEKLFIEKKKHEIKKKLKESDDKTFLQIIVNYIHRNYTQEGLEEVFKKYHISDLEFEIIQETLYYNQPLCPKVKNKLQKILE